MQNLFVSDCKMYLSQIEKCICLELETVYVLIAEEDFCVIALDTRLSGHGYAILYYITFWSVFVTIIKRLSGHGYAILSREQPKLFKLSETTVLGSTGCWCDILTFCKVCIFIDFQPWDDLWKKSCKVAEMRLKTYRHTHGRTMATPAVAQMTATMLYGKRLESLFITKECRKTKWPGSSPTTSQTSWPAWTRMGRELSTAMTLSATQRGLVCSNIVKSRMDKNVLLVQVWIQGRRQCCLSAAASSW